MTVRKKRTSKKDTPQENLGLKYSLAELPSHGRLGYDDTIEYRDILVRDEKELSSATDRTFNQILNKVMKSLLKDQDIYDDLTIYDRDFLLVWIWANNYTPEKTIEFTCPHCEAENTYQIDLTQMKVNDLDKDFKKDYKLELTSGEEIGIHLITVKDEEIARKYAAVSKNKIDETFAILCQSIDFDVVIPLKEKVKRAEIMTGKEMAVVRGFHAAYKYGFDDVVERDCPKCQEVSTFSVPFKIEWFLPTISDDFK